MCLTFSPLAISTVRHFQSTTTRAVGERERTRLGDIGVSQLLDLVSGTAFLLRYGMTTSVCQWRLQLWGTGARALLDFQQFHFWLTLE